MGKRELKISPLHDRKTAPFAKKKLEIRISRDMKEYLEQIWILDHRSFRRLLSHDVSFFLFPNRGWQVTL